MSPDATQSSFASRRRFKTNGMFFLWKKSAFLLEPHRHIIQHLLSQRACTSDAGSNMLCRLHFSCIMGLKMNMRMPEA